jgi:hypothetical protein
MQKPTLGDYQTMLNIGPLVEEGVPFLALYSFHNQTKHLRVGFERRIKEQ